MDPFAVSHFSDKALLHDLKTLVAQDCRATAVLLTRIAEVYERQLYLREGYPSMSEYCLHELHLSEAAAYKRIEVARLAREFPAVLVALAEGRVHMRAVLMLARHLTSGNADELVVSSPPFPTPATIPVSAAPGRIEAPSPATRPFAPERIPATIPVSAAPGRIEAPSPPTRPFAPERIP